MSSACSKYLLLGPESVLMAKLCVLQMHSEKYMTAARSALCPDKVITDHQFRSGSAAEYQESIRELWALD
jgi:hypothetical protein